MEGSVIIFTEYDLKSTVYFEVIDETMAETQIRGAALNKRKIFIFHTLALESLFRLDLGISLLLDCHPLN